MGAAKHDINIEQGATYYKTYTLKDSAGAEVDLTGWSVAGQIRAKYDSASALASFTCTILNQVTYPGKFTVLLSAGTTAGIAVDPALGASRKPTAYVYDIEVTKSDSTKDRILEGKCYVSPEVTR
jgi:hypothetical protein